MLTLRKVSKRKGSRLILNQVSLQLEPGECVALVGPNGAGKTTLLRVAATLMKPDEGELTVSGLSPKDTVSRLKMREQIGYLDHQTMLYPQLTVEENLLFSGRMYFLAEDYLNRKVDHLLDQLRVLHRKHDQVRSLSRGMKQKVALARTLLHEPKLLLLDEPLTGLDQEAVEVLKGILAREKKKGKAILLASHKVEMLEGILDRTLHIKAGRLGKDK
jgi:heme exporter protein A